MIGRSNDPPSLDDLLGDGEREPQDADQMIFQMQSWAAATQAAAKKNAPSPAQATE